MLFHQSSVTRSEQDTIWAADLVSTCIPGSEWLPIANRILKLPWMISFDYIDSDTTNIEYISEAASLDY